LDKEEKDLKNMPAFSQLSLALSRFYSILLLRKNKKKPVFFSSKPPKQHLSFLRANSL
jgi:hypothetical protein